jgi:hypothetical protein
MNNEIPAYAGTTEGKKRNDKKITGMTKKIHNKRLG